MIQKFLSGLVIIGFIIGFVYILNYGIIKNEKYECLVWLQQSKEFEGYYFIDWQLEQCKIHKINLSNN